MSKYASAKSEGQGQAQMSSSSGKKGSFSSSFRSENTVMMGSDEGDRKMKGFSKAFIERFETLEEVTQAIRNEGIEHCSLIFGIDYTLSNRTQGCESFGGLSLHDVTQNRANPYQQVICILGETLEPLNDEDCIPAYGFGDKTTKGDSVFALKEDGECEDFSEVLDVYDTITPNVKLSGPTNFVPLIQKAIEIVKKKKKYHILVIVADGQVTNEEANIAAIEEASNYPLSIIVIGVGDGPWDVMEDFDKKLVNRHFDNFRFCNYHKCVCEARNPQAAVALSALQLVPDQYACIRKFNLIEKMGGGRGHDHDEPQQRKF